MLTHAQFIGLATITLIGFLATFLLGRKFPTKPNQTEIGRQYLKETLELWYGPRRIWHCIQIAVKEETSNGKMKFAILESHDERITICHFPEAMATGDEVQFRWPEEGEFTSSPSASIVDYCMIAEVRISSNFNARSVQSIGLTIRTENCLINADITTVGQLRQTPAAKLLQLRNFGKLALQECHVSLSTLGINVEDWVENL